MSKITQEQMERLVATAAVDKNVRDGLLSRPKETAHQLGIEIDNDDVAELRKITVDLKRFGGNPKLNPDDARGWSLGICHIRQIITRPMLNKP